MATARLAAAAGFGSDTSWQTLCPCLPLQCFKRKICMIKMHYNAAGMGRHAWVFIRGQGLWARRHQPSRSQNTLGTRKSRPATLEIKLQSSKFSGQ